MVFKLDICIKYDVCESATVLSWVFNVYGEETFVCKSRTMRAIAGYVSSIKKGFVERLTLIATKRSSFKLEMIVTSSSMNQVLQNGTQYMGVS